MPQFYQVETTETVEQVLSDLLREVHSKETDLASLTKRAQAEATRTEQLQETQRRTREDIEKQHSKAAQHSLHTHLRTRPPLWLQKEKEA